MEQVDFVLSGTLLDGVKSVHEAIDALTRMEAISNWPQTENIKKAKAVLIDRFLEDDFGIKPIPAQLGESDKS